MKDLILFLTSTFIFCVFLTSITFAQSFTPEGPVPIFEDVPVQPQGPGCGNIEITQSTSQSLLGAGLACHNTGTGFVLENSFYRAFNLNSFGINNDFKICAVEVGILTAATNSGSQPLTINLYTSNPAFPNGVLTQIGTTSIQLSNQSNTIASIPVTGTASAGSELVVEIFIPDGQAASNTFRIGSNTAPETGPSYIRAPLCGEPTPVTTADINFPEVHFVINVRGNEIVVSPIPTLSEWGLLAMAGILGLVGFMVIRRRKLTA
jgi:hypothetical protein